MKKSVDVSKFVGYHPIKKNTLHDAEEYLQKVIVLYQMIKDISKKKLSSELTSLELEKVLVGYDYFSSYKHDIEQLKVYVSHRIGNLKIQIQNYKEGKYSNIISD